MTVQEWFAKYGRFAQMVRGRNDDEQSNTVGRLVGWDRSHRGERLLIQPSDPNKGWDPSGDGVHFFDGISARNCFWVHPDFTIPEASEPVLAAQRIPATDYKALYEDAQRTIERLSKPEYRRCVSTDGKGWLCLFHGGHEGAHMYQRNTIQATVNVAGIDKVKSILAAADTVIRYVAGIHCLAPEHRVKVRELVQEYARVTGKDK